VSEPVAVLSGVVARDSAGPRGHARGALQGVTASLAPGVHAFLGAPEDGTIALCEVLAGARRALRGSVRVHGEDPWASPAARARTGALLPFPDVPDARSVRAAVGQALAALGAAAGEADAALGALGLGSLAARPTRGLSFAEARAVELALALAVAGRAEAPLVVLFEPGADLAIPGAARAVDDAIAKQREAGACVVVATSSPADARRLGDVLWILHRGTLVRREAGDGKTLAPGEAEIAVWLGQDRGAAARALAAKVCQSPAIRSVYCDDPPPGAGRSPTLRVRGPDRDACALAVLDAAASEGIDVEAITSSVPDLPAVRSATLAWLQRARAAQGAAVKTVGARSGAAGGAVGPQGAAAGPSGGSAEATAGVEKLRSGSAELIGGGEGASGGSAELIGGGEAASGGSAELIGGGEGASGGSAEPIGGGEAASGSSAEPIGAPRTAPTSSAEPIGASQQGLGGSPEPPGDAAPGGQVGRDGVASVASHERKEGS
jgi:ABC-2 type transport system ATP-binding protein